MKKLVIALFVSMLSIASFASETVKATNDERLSILDLVSGVKTTYSPVSGLEAKLVDLLVSDGINPIRLVLVLSNGNPMEENRIFELGKHIFEVESIEFVKEDVLVINYIQDSFDEDGENIQIKGSLQVEVLRNAKGELSGEVIVTSL